ncbi:MAG: hypothetical protein FIA95_10660 [Gemmatimonadetes bacterium]|nr:hypothetical protein [Gemmatimonadota bacterium]
MTTPYRRSALLALLALAPLAAGSDASRGSPGAGAESAPPVPVNTQAAAPAGALELAATLGIANAREPSPGLLTSAQISQAQMDALAQAGFTTFISLRPPTEEGAGWEEAYAAQRGLSFARIPIAGPDGLTRENAEALDRILQAAGEGRTALYCASSNRVGALMAMRAHWLKGATPEEALARGKAAGMTRREPDVARLLGGTP